MTVRLRALAATAALSVAATSGLAAAQGGAAQSQRDTRILMLGTAGGPPLHEDRSEPATLLIVDGKPYLIDCGIGTERRLLKAGIASQTIGTIFLTHLHPDHDLGLAAVLANDFQHIDLRGAKRSIGIYGPPQTKALVDAAWRFISIPYEVFAAEGGGPSGGIPTQSPFEVHEIDTGAVYHDDRIRVVAVENSHYALMPPASRAAMKSYSYRFETPHGVIVFTGDTGPSDAVTRLARGADVLVTEAHDVAQQIRLVNRMADQNHWSTERRKEFMAHMTEEHLGLEDAGEMASKARVGAVLLYHMNPIDPATYVAGVRQHFSGPVFAGADLERYCLSASGAERASGTEAFGLCK